MECDYYLVSGPSGVGLGSAVRRLNQFLGGSSSPPIDIEDILCENLPATRERLREAGKDLAPSTKVRMRDVTWELPKKVVKELWEQATEQALLRLSQAPENARILTAKFVYYGGRRHEFYSPISVRRIRTGTYRPRAVLVLIDDVFDMYSRLSTKGELFERESNWKVYLRRLKADEQVDFAQLDQRDRQALALRHTVGQMRRILTWRQTVISAAENIALEAECPLLVWATKQLAEPVATWLKDPARTPRTYLSHPISGPRREQNMARDHKWPEIVNQVNTIQAALQEEGVVCVMPSGIDELRFKPFAGGETPSRLPRHSPELGIRWPMPVGDLVWEAHQGTTDGEFTEILNVDDLAGKSGSIAVDSNSGRRRDATVRGLEDIISDQVSSRDHLFVEHCRGLLVFRPLFGGNEYTHGVQSEFDHWAHLSRRNDDRRAAFVHFVDDVEHFRKAIAANPDIAGRNSAVQTGLIDCVAKETQNSVERASRLVYDIQAGKEEASLLDEGFFPEEVEKARTGMAAFSLKAENEWLNRYLRCGHLAAFVKPHQIKVWPDVRDTAHFKQLVPEIAGFLRS